jgi:hypothetical protein
MIIRLIYTVFLGILAALFIGWGIAAFYPAPQRPDYPPVVSQPLNLKTDEGITTSVESPEERAAQQSYDAAARKHDKEIFPTYNRNVSVLAMIGAIVVLVISLVFLKKIELLSDGLLFGGVLTTLYAIIRGFMGNDPKYGFIVVAIGLVIALILGYVKFIHPEKSRT